MAQYWLVVPSRKCSLWCSRSSYCACNHHVFHFLFLQEFTGWVFSCFCFVLFHSFITGEVIISNENLLSYFLLQKTVIKGYFPNSTGWGVRSGLAVLVLVVEPLLLSLAVWVGVVVKTEPNSSSMVWWKAKGKQAKVTPRENPVRYCELRVVKHCNKFPKEAVQSLSSQISKNQLDIILSSAIQQLALLWAGVGPHNFRGSL